jgi:peptidoglycan/xylan/chitin deacetylase (PgdA/CDA1 family)
MASSPMRWLDAISQRISSAWNRHSRRNNRGVVLLFHEVHDDDDGYKRNLKAGCSAPFLDAIIGRLVHDRWDIVPLDEALSRLERDDASRRFAVLTFDDGYRNTMTRALPILERYAAPFTVYVPTGSITRELPSWWLGLRSLFQRHDTVTIPPIAKTYECRDTAAKTTACAEVRRWAHEDYRRLPALIETLRAYDISLPALNRATFMDETELRTLARHPLVTIGGHTESHPALALLASAEARREIDDNRRYLERLLDRPIRHFAYPYGLPGAFGDREVALAADIGFRTAVTAQSDSVSTGDRRVPHRMPRLEMAGSTDHHVEHCFSALREI